MVDTSRYLVGGPLNYGYGQPSGDIVQSPPWPQLSQNGHAILQQFKVVYILSINIALVE